NKLVLKSLGDFKLCVVNAKVTFLSANNFGLVGFWFHALKSCMESFDAKNAFSTSKASGKLIGIIIGAFIAFISSRRSYSSPPPKITYWMLNRSPTLSARNALALLPASKIWTIDLLLFNASIDRSFVFEWPLPYQSAS